MEQLDSAQQCFRKSRCSCQETRPDTASPSYSLTQKQLARKIFKFRESQQLGELLHINNQFDLKGQQQKRLIIQQKSKASRRRWKQLRRAKSQRQKKQHKQLLLEIKYRQEQSIKESLIKRQKAQNERKYIREQSFEKALMHRLSSKKQAKLNTKLAKDKEFQSYVNMKFHIWNKLKIKAEDFSRHPQEQDFTLFQKILKERARKASLKRELVAESEQRSKQLQFSLRQRAQSARVRAKLKADQIY